MILDDTLAETIALLNNGVSLAEASRMLGISRSQLSRRLNTLMKRGAVLKYLNVFIDRLHTPVSVMISEAKQKAQGLRCLIGSPPTVISYYSYAARPVTISYVRDDYSGVDAGSIVAGTCRAVFYGRITQVLIPLQEAEAVKPRFRLIDSRELVGSPAPLDEADEIIALELFRVFNPCTITGNWRLNDLVKIVEGSLGARDTRHHMVRHVNALTLKRYVYRGDGVYAVILVASDTLETLATLLSQLKESGILIDVEQVNMIGSNPFTGLIHAWISPYKLYEPENGHEFTDGASYSIYPVISAK